MNHLASQPQTVESLNYNLQATSPTISQAQQSSPTDNLEDESASDSGGSRSPSPEHLGEGSNPSRVRKKRERACDSCRGLKVKCLREPGDPTSTCRRCSRAKRTCITTPSTRKRRVTKPEPQLVALLEARVQELERTIQQLSTQDSHDQAHFKSVPLVQKASSPVVDAPGSPLNRQNPPQNPTASREPGETRPKKRKASDLRDVPPIRTDHQVEAGHIPPHHLPPVFDHSDISPSIDDIMSRQNANEVFRRFVDKFLHVFPAVPLSADSKADSVRSTKPILFLAILACNCQGIVGPATQQSLLDLLRDTFADCQWRKGEKTVEIIQAYHITAMCYRPPAHFSQTNFYQLAVLALVMGIDLGLGRRMEPQIGSATQQMHDQVNTRESRRAWLVSYYLCTSISMMLRRPPIARFSRYEDECLRILSDGPDASLSDKMLVQHIKFAQLTEETFTEFKFHDSKAGATMDDQRVVGAVQLFNEKLDRLLDNIPPELDSTLLRYSAFAARINIHEVALHHSKTQEIFWPPLFDVGVVQGNEKLEVFNSEQVTSMLTCMTAAHGLLKMYLDFPHVRQSNMPAFFTIRTTYALVILVKLLRASKSSPEIRRYIREDVLELDQYLSKTEAVFARVAAADPGCHHSKFILVVRRLRGHYERIRDGPEVTDDEISNNVKPPQPRRRVSNADASPATAINRKETVSSPLQVLSEVAVSASSAANDAILAKVLNPNSNPISYIPTNSAIEHSNTQRQGYALSNAPSGQQTFHTPQLQQNPNWTMARSTATAPTSQHDGSSVAGLAWGSVMPSSEALMNVDPMFMAPSLVEANNPYLFDGNFHGNPNGLGVPGMEFYGFGGYGL